MRRTPGGTIGSLGVEHKILPQLSVELEGMLAESIIGNYLTRSWVSRGIRYYPGKRTSAKGGKYKANNFTGSYFRTNYQHRFAKGKNSFSDSYSSSVNFSYGWQQKVGKFGQLDLAAEISYETETKTFRIGNRIGGGLGYGKSKIIRTLSDETKYDTEGTQWSTPIIFVGNPNILIRDGGISLGVDLGGEFHMLNYWTIRPTISGDYSNFRVNSFQPSETRRSLYFSYDFNIEVRKYLGIRKQLAKGKSPLAFSGFYLAFQIANIYERVELVSPFVSTDDRNGFFLDQQVGIGWQHKVGNRFLFDVNWGVRHTYDRIENYGDLKIGILLKK